MNLGRSGHGPLLMLIHSATNSSALSDTQRRLFYDNEARRLQKQKAYYEITEISSVSQMFPFVFDVTHEWIYNAGCFTLTNFGGKAVLMS